MKRAKAELVLLLALMGIALFSGCLRLMEEGSVDHTSTSTPSSMDASTKTTTPLPATTPSPTPTATPKRLSTGTYIKDSLRNGYGELTIKNQLNEKDAVTVLTLIGSKSPLISVYIRAEDSFTIKGIKDGLYELYFSLGEDWDEKQGRFTKNASFERFEDPIEFITTYDTYTIYEVTLYGVVGGNAATENVPASSFQTCAEGG